MQQVSRETRVAYERRLERALVPAPQRPAYHKWTRFYLDFCHKYGHAPRSGLNQATTNRWGYLRRSIRLNGLNRTHALHSIGS